MPRRHRRTNRSSHESSGSTNRNHESSASAPSARLQMEALRQATANLFEISSNLSARLAHLGDAFKELAQMIAEYLPGEYGQRVLGILEKQDDLAQGATQLLDAGTQALGDNETEERPAVVAPPPPPPPVQD